MPEGIKKKSVINSARYSREDKEKEKSFDLS